MLRKTLSIMRGLPTVLLLVMATAAGCIHRTEWRTRALVRCPSWDRSARIELSAEVQKRTFSLQEPIVVTKVLRNVGETDAVVSEELLWEGISATSVDPKYVQGFFFDHSPGYVPKYDVLGPGESISTTLDLTEFPYGVNTSGRYAITVAHSHNCVAEDHQWKPPDWVIRLPDFRIKVIEEAP